MNRFYSRRSRSAGRKLLRRSGGFSAEKRRQAWARLARDLPLDKLDTMIVPARLADLPRLAPEILAGRVRGRVVVAIKA